CALATVVSLARPDERRLPVVLASFGIYLAAAHFVMRPLGRALAGLWTRSRWIALPAVIALLVVSAWATDTAGVHAIFGAFAAGLVIPTARSSRTTLRDGLGDAVVVLLDLLRVGRGLRMQAGALNVASFGALLGAVIVVASVGKVAGGMFGARIAGMGWRDALAVGADEHARADGAGGPPSGPRPGILSSRLFSVMVLMALATTRGDDARRALAAAASVRQPPGRDGRSLRGAALRGQADRSDLKDEAPYCVACGGMDTAVDAGAAPRAIAEHVSPLAAKPDGHCGAPTQVLRRLDQTWPGQQQCPAVSSEMTRSRPQARAAADRRRREQGGRRRGGITHRCARLAARREAGRALRRSDAGATQAGPDLAGPATVSRGLVRDHLARRTGPKGAGGRRPSGGGCRRGGSTRRCAHLAARREAGRALRRSDAGAAQAGPDLAGPAAVSAVSSRSPGRSHRPAVPGAAEGGPTPAPAGMETRPRRPGR
ncbi:MAG: cation:proton antiporter, partial [Deltaproteobacteria bacterium]|nr:cation:proton antiporter [Deltaproteobacteria bacterium]